jgi:hypothetical protein
MSYNPGSDKPSLAADIFVGEIEVRISHLTLR